MQMSALDQETINTYSIVGCVPATMCVTPEMISRSQIVVARRLTAHKGGGSR